MNFALDFVANRPGSSVTMIGHSKGGAEALANALITNSNAITFNSAVLWASQNGLSIAAENFTGTMLNFVVDGDILGLLNSFLVSTRVLVEIPIGQSIQLPTQYEVPWHIMASFLTAAPTALFVNALRNHSMEAVIQALREAGGDY